MFGSDDQGIAKGLTAATGAADNCVLLRDGRHRRGMVLMDRAQRQRRFKELKEEHIRALSTGDLETLERVQAELAELMKRDGGQDADPR